MTTALLLPLLLLPTGAPTATDSAEPTCCEQAVMGSSAAEAGKLAGTNGEVRMRKLHLVRPELLPYPLAYEIYC